MSMFFIEYDLRKQRDYQTLYQELKKLKAVRVLESTWCVRYAGARCVDLRDYLKKFIDQDDRLCVAEISDWASRNALSDLNK